MNAATRQPIAAMLSKRWHDPAAWAATADSFVTLLAVALPWSTSLVSIFAVGFLISMLPLLDIRAFLASLKRPICALPIGLFALAALGTLWSDVSWGERLYAVGPMAKLATMPILLYHFQRSARGMQVFIAFLVSCVLLMIMSWIVAFEPRLALKPGAAYGVPVKNYIDQSHEFALCAVALAYPVIRLLRDRRTWPALALTVMALGFVVNMLFVSVSRTALVTMPIMLAVFVLFRLKWQSVVIVVCSAAILAGLAWAASPRLRETVDRFSVEYRLYNEQNLSTSIGQRLQFWQKSWRFFSMAPVFGHGTGSIHVLFEEAAKGRSGAAAEIVSNPHNQTLNVAVQWGAIGVVLLYAMWLVHLSLFRGEAVTSGIGLIVVVQNIFTSLFNSHISDFNEGWIYVLGVSIAGGMVLTIGSQGAPIEARAAAQP